MKTDRKNGLTFSDYFKKIYNGSNLSMHDSFVLARELWERNVDIYNALEIAND